MAKSTVLFNNQHLTLEIFEDGIYRLSLFNDENHWAGDMTFTNKGIIYNDIDEVDGGE